MSDERRAAGAQAPSGTDVAGGSPAPATGQASAPLLPPADPTGVAGDHVPDFGSTWGELRDRPPEPLAVAPSALGVWDLAWPTIASFGAQTLVRFVDFAMVGGLGPDALAAVGMGGQVYWLVQSLANLAPTGLAAILARAWGAGAAGMADVALRQSLVFGTVLAALVTLVGLPLSDSLIRIYGVDEGVVALGGDYVFWLLAGAVPFSLSLVFGAALRAAGDARTPLVVGIGANALNVVLNWMLIYGHLGAPALGVAGAGIASSLSMLAQALVFVWLWRARRLVLQPSDASFAPDLAMLRRIAFVGYPAAIEQALFQVGLVAFQRIMSLHGIAAIAAYHVGAQVLSFSFIPGIGFATAAGTLVGQRLGEGAPARAERAGWRANAGAVLSMSAMGALVVAFAEPLARIFTDDPEVVALSVDFIWILGAVQPLMAIEFALGGALRGAGDTVYPMLASFLGLFVMRLLTAFALVEWADATIQMLWCVLILDYASKALLLARRFRLGGWKSLEV